MGLFDIFSWGPSESAILGQVRKAKERYAQPDYRRMAMDKLLKWDTDESIRGLLERFTVVVQSPHWDENEKTWLKEELINIGSRVLPLLRDFIMEKNDINHALEAYKNIAKSGEFSQILIDSLKCRPPGDHRSVQGKTEIIAAISLTEDIDKDELLLPYLGDHSDDVQCSVIETLMHSKNKDTQEEIINLLGSEVHSGRVVRAAANAVCGLKLAVPDNTKLNDVVKEDFRIDSGQLIRLNNS